MYIFGYLGFAEGVGGRYFEGEEEENSREESKRGGQCQHKHQQAGQQKGG